LGDGVTATDFQRLRKQLQDKTNVSLKSANLKPERERRPPGDALIGRFLHVARHDTTMDPDASPAARRRAELRRLRNVALLETLVSTDARIGEVVGLNVGDLLDDQAALIRRGVGKGDKSRVAFFDDQAWFALQAYVGETGAAHGAAPIFLRHDRGAGGACPYVCYRLPDSGSRRLRLHPLFAPLSSTPPPLSLRCLLLRRRDRLSARGAALRPSPSGAASLLIKTLDFSTIHQTANWVLTLPLLEVV
jgi:integrase